MAIKRTPIHGPISKSTHWWWEAPRLPELESDSADDPAAAPHTIDARTSAANGSRLGQRP